MSLGFADLNFLLLFFDQRERCRHLVATETDVLQYVGEGETEPQQERRQTQEGERQDPLLYRFYDSLLQEVFNFRSLPRI